MRTLVFLWSCATAHPVPDHPRNFDECAFECQSGKEMCETDCRPIYDTGAGSAATMAWEQCRQLCRDRDGGCRAECGRRFKPK
jgi:hypothetical protein